MVSKFKFLSSKNYLNNADLIVIWIFVFTFLIAGNFLKQFPALYYPLMMVVLLYFPGYLLTSAFFNPPKNLTSIERGALIIVLDFSLITFSALWLSYINSEINGKNLLSMLIVIMIVSTGICIYRRYLSINNKVNFEKNIKVLEKENLLKVTPILLLALICIAVIANSLQSERIGERFSEFYILGQDSKGQKTTIITQDVSIIHIYVINHELEPKIYKLRIHGNNYFEEIPIGKIDPKGVWNISLEFSKYHDQEKLLFELYINDSPQPYRELHVWLNNQ